MLDPFAVRNWRGFRFRFRFRFSFFLLVFRLISCQWSHERTNFGVVAAETRPRRGDFFLQDKALGLPSTDPVESSLRAVNSFSSPLLCKVSELLPHGCL